VSVGSRILETMTDPIDEWLLKHVDERFYEAFPRDYFHDSLMLALAALQAPRRTLSVLTEDQFFRGSDDENVLQLRLDPDDLDEESYRKTAKLQIVNLYYHTLETFLRLFLAHRPGVDRPWLEMARETEFRKFKSKAAKLARISATWDGSHTEDEAFRLAFWPERSPDDQDARLLSAAKEWMRLAASETIDGPAYNAFKHGLGLQSGEELLAWYPAGQDPRQNRDAEPVFKADGDALILLRWEKEADGSRHWVRETRWLRLKEKISVTFVVHRWYIPALLAVGATRFLGRDLEPFSLPAWGPGDALRHIYREPGIRMTQFSQKLGIADWPRERRRARRRHSR
jgi:hypothetical protein